MVGRLHGQKPNLRGGGDGGGSKACSSSIPDFSITTWARCSAETARGILSLAEPFGVGVGQGAGVGAVTVRGGAGVGFSGAAACSSSARGVGDFLGLGVSSSVRASLVVFPFLRAVSLDFFFVDFGLGVGV